MEQVPGCYPSYGARIASPSWTFLLPCLAPQYRFRRTGQDLLSRWLCARRSRKCCPRMPWRCPRSGSRLLQSPFPGGKGDRGLETRDRPLLPEQVCSSNSVQDGDSRLCASVRQRGGFHSFHGFEGRVFLDTRSSVIEEAIEVPVGRDSLLVQGSLFRTVDCPAGLHQGVCHRVCMGAFPRDSSSSVPGRLAGPRLFGGGVQKERPGSALSLSLLRDRDKQGEVRSRTLADRALPRYDHRYRGHQDFSVSCASREISVSGGDVLYHDRSPHSALAGGFGSPGIAGEVGSSQSTSNALSAVAFEDALVPRVRFSLPPGALVPGGEEEFVLDGEVSSSQGGSIWDTCSRSTPVLGRVSVWVGRTPPRSEGFRGVVGAGEVAAHQSSGNESSIFIWNFSHSLAGFCPDQDACGVERRSCSVDVASARDWRLCIFGSIEM